jgi:hypothetical protein
MPHFDKFKLFGEKANPSKAERNELRDVLGELVRAYQERESSP